MLFTGVRQRVRGWKAEHVDSLSLSDLHNMVLLTTAQRWSTDHIQILYKRQKALSTTTGRKYVMLDHACKRTHLSEGEKH